MYFQEVKNVEKITEKCFVLNYLKINGVVRFDSTFMVGRIFSFFCYKMSCGGRILKIFSILESLKILKNFLKILFFSKTEEILHRKLSSGNNLTKSYKKNTEDIINLKI